MYLLYRSRHVVSWLPAFVIGGCLLFISQHAVLQVKPHYDDTVMELSLAEPEPEPPQPEPIPEPQPEPPPEPQTQPEPQPEPEPIAEPVVPAPEPVIQSQPIVKPKPKPKPKPETKPKPVAEKAPQPQARVAPRSPAVNRPVSQPSAPPAPPAPPAPKVNAQAVENDYLQALRRELEQRKRYPSGRQASLERPQGNVEVWLEVDRSGRVLSSGIASRAPSMLLNRAALSSLQSISQLKPFPEEAFAGQRSKRFTATFNYQAP
ncbi:energy transducer TonB [Erwinia sp. JUb26]|uniref:energy transducer TonB family protein n=1 Tax=Erwinia sp. JUb26 TaxID=2485126 RepID=UPI000F46C82E|nr:TonB family protein [Erwinia sp. JUb26]ROR10149.1 outer membrane transport energization protein TonB [Erwinia sp. JUb26]